MTQDLKQRIREAGERVFLVFGEEPFLTERAVRSAKELLHPDFAALNTTVMEEKTPSVDKLIEISESVPFMDELRLVLVRSDLFRSGDKGLKKADEEKLLQYLQHPAPSAVLIFAPKEVDKRSALYRSLKKNHTVIENNSLDRMAVKKWCEAAAKELGFTLGKERTELFIQRSGYLNKETLRDLSFLHQELTKLSAVDREKKNISKEDIIALFEEEKESDVFLFVDAVVRQDAKQAMLLYHDRVGKGESPLLLLSMMGRQFALIGRCHLLLKRGYSAAMIAEKFDLHPYAVKKSVEHCKKVSYEQAIRLLRVISSIELRIKTGVIREEVGVELTIARALERRAK